MGHLQKDGEILKICAWELVLLGQKDRQGQKKKVSTLRCAQDRGIICCETLRATLAMETAVTHTAHTALT